MLSSVVLIFEHPIVWIFFLYIYHFMTTHVVAKSSSIVHAIRINSYTTKLNARVEEATIVKLVCRQILFEFDWAKSVSLKNGSLEARGYLMPSLYTGSEKVQEVFLFSLYLEKLPSVLFSTFTREAFQSIRTNDDLHLRRFFILMHYKTKAVRTQWSLNVRFDIVKSWSTEEFETAAELRRDKSRTHFHEYYMLPVPPEGLAQNTTIGVHRNELYLLPDKFESLLNTYFLFILKGYFPRSTIESKPSTFVRSFSVSNAYYDPDLIYMENKCATGNFIMNSNGLIEFGIHSTSSYDQYRCDGTLNFVDLPHKDLDFICFNQGCTNITASFSNVSFANMHLFPLFRSQIKTTFTCLYNDTQVVRWCLEGKLIPQNQDITLIDENILNRWSQCISRNHIGSETSFNDRTICLCVHPEDFPHILFLETYEKWKELGARFGPGEKLCVHTKAVRDSIYKWDWIYYSRPPWLSPFQKMKKGSKRKAIPSRAYLRRICEKVRRLKSLPDHLRMVYKMCAGELDLEVKAHGFKRLE